MEVKTVHETYTCDLPTVLNEWKSCFQKLFTTDEHYPLKQKPCGIGSTPLNSGISILDVKNAINSLNKNKSPGYDQIPSEVLNNNTCLNYLHELFCVCFETGKIPKSWKHGIITPVLKDPSTDAQDPIKYRGITVTSAVYKAYCAVLNKKLTTWAEVNNQIGDNQNGF